MIILQSSYDSLTVILRSSCDPLCSFGHLTFVLKLCYDVYIILGSSHDNLMIIIQ